MFGKKSKVTKKNEGVGVDSQPLSLKIGNESFIQVRLLEAINKNLIQVVGQLTEIKVLLSEKK